MNIPYVLKETKAPPLCIFLPFGGVDKEHSWLLKSLTATCLRSMTIREAKCSFLIASSLLTAFFFLAHPRSPPLLTLSKCISLSMSLSLPLSQFFLSPFSISFPFVVPVSSLASAFHLLRVCPQFSVWPAPPLLHRRSAQVPSVFIHLEN